jgi:hypothetical protein
LGELGEICEMACQSHNLRGSNWRIGLFSFLSSPFPIPIFFFLDLAAKQMSKHLTSVRLLDLKKKKRKEKTLRLHFSLEDGPALQIAGISKWTVIDLQSTCRLFSRSRSQQFPQCSMVKWQLRVPCAIPIVANSVRSQPIEYPS